MVSEAANLYEFLKKNTPPKLLIVQDDKKAQRAKAVFDSLKIPAVTLPDIRVFFEDDLRSFYEEVREYILGLLKFYKNQSSSLIIPLHTLKLPAPKKELFDEFEIEFAQTINLNELKDRLFFWGYSFVDIVTQKGEVSFRGDIIDIFPPNSKTPYRINLFDEEVESIYPFDLKTQKRFKEELESIKITPAFLALNRESFEKLNSRVQKAKFNSFSKDIFSFGLWVLEEMGEFLVDKFEGFFLEDLSKELKESDSFGEIKSKILPLLKNITPPAKEYKELEVIDINKLIELHKDKKIKVLAKDKTTIRASILKNLKEIEIIYSDGIINLIGKDELILSINRKKAPKRVKKASLILDEIGVGDYVVHQNYGVGLFKGIQKREILGAKREFLAIEYQKGDMLYVPVESLEVVDRYIADSSSLPSVDRLGKGNFKNLKSKVKSKLFAIASEIINISAKRALKKGIILEADEVEFELFLSQAGFEHTPDQLEAINAIKEELKSGKIMDRLLSGDVGFGKTEVAMSAIFITVKAGFQAVMIAPTTLLANQHYKTLKERFAPWKIEVAKLDRFTPAKEKKRVLKELKEGNLKVVVGTHSLFRAEFKNLALVIVDEEHKFGVKQKESLKELSINCHLLSMSATPIPRSLNMALSKIKTFSEILTPPNQRVGVRTFVKEFNPQIIKEAILREIKRGGQIFYIYNSISSIKSKEDEIKELLPNLKITTLHSKTPPAKMEEEMLKFESKEYDLLLSTTIVESGIHLPNVNTIIVDGAQKFGIADLHQLRGRVGRGKREGFCYLLVDDKESLSPKAKRRLLALESHSELGSGAVLAMYDLEIRGGGNLIGEAQSGHIKQIGYSLYLKMLEESIKELSGKKEVLEVVELNLQVDAYLSDEIIYEDRLRLELYRRFAQANDTQEVYEIEAEIIDRFGKLDKVSRQYIDLIVIKVLAKRATISKVSSYGERVFIEFADGKKEILNAPSKDDDDIINTALEYLKNLKTKSQ